MSVSSLSSVSSTLGATMPTTVSRSPSLRGRVKALGQAVQQSLDEADASMSTKGSFLLGFMLSEYNLGVLIMVRRMKASDNPKSTFRAQAPHDV